MRTRDVAPGDAIAVHVDTSGGYRTAIARIDAHLGALSLHIAGDRPHWGSTVSSRGGSEDDESFLLTLPTDAPIGDATLSLDVEFVMAVPIAGSFENETRSDYVSAPITVLSGDRRIMRRRLDRISAFAAWGLAFGISYAAARWLGVRRRRRSISELLHSRSDVVQPPKAFRARNKYTEELVLLAGCLAIATIAMIGQWAFVRPILRTTTMQSKPFLSALLAMWSLALVLGVWRGLRARRRASQ